MSRPSFEDIYTQMATLISKRSTCSRLQVGCVITSTDHRYVYSLGYNGGASGLKNECASLEPGQCGHIHGELNAIINCTISRTTPKNVYVTHLPCVMCAKALINLGGVVRVLYREDYRIKDSVELLNAVGINIEQYQTGS